MRNASAAESGERDPQAARAAALRLLARRDYASGELRGRLTELGFGTEETGALLEELSREGAVDDARYAQNYVAWHARRGQGPVRIGADLRRFGLPDAVVTAALEAGIDWGQRALEVCRTRFGAGTPGDWSEKARRARFLQYRGFSSDHIRAAVGAVPDLD